MSVRRSRAALLLGRLLYIGVCWSFVCKHLSKDGHVTYFACGWGPCFALVVKLNALSLDVWRVDIGMRKALNLLQEQS